MEGGRRRESDLRLMSILSEQERSTPNFFSFRSSRYPKMHASVNTPSVPLNFEELGFSAGIKGCVNDVNIMTNPVTKKFS
jgi:hypothetical protein